VTDFLAPIFAFVLGACIGSFLNVCISRWPAELSVVSPRSRCPNCHRPISAAENIPLLSWVLLRGKCRGCGLRISMMYPAIELVTALGWLAAVLSFGASLTALRVAIFGTVLLGIAVTDAMHYIIPDGFTVFGLVWVFVTSLAATFLGDPGPFASPLEALIGACTGAGAIAIAGWLGEVMLKREAMGFGDVTLMAVVGAALGPGRSLLVIFVGAFLGTVVFLGFVVPVTRLRGARSAAQLELPIAVPRPEMPQVPFGVFLAPAALLTLLWGERFIGWYLSRVGS
jgi:leader peptidase (prepilin peptidase)/N-methyltransferase